MGALIATLVLHVTGWLHAGTTGYAAAMTAYSAGEHRRGLPGSAAGRDRLGRVRAVLLGGAVQTGALLVHGHRAELAALVAGSCCLRRSWAWCGTSTR